MTQEDKELLLKDLCARLQHGVVIHFDEKTSQDDERLYGMRENGGKLLINDAFYIEEVKPYLFPISSMTEEQTEEYYSLADDVTIKPGQGSYFGIKIHCIKLGISDNPHEEVWDWIDLDAIDWLNAHHFDYRGLIEKGLAIDATDKNIY